MASQYNEARAMDLELAEAAEAAGDDTATSSAPELPVSQNTTEVQLQLRVISLLQALLQQQAPKRLPFPPLPRIRTARDEVRSRRRERHRGRLLAIVADAQARFAALQLRAGDQVADEQPAGAPVVDLGRELVEDVT